MRETYRKTLREVEKALETASQIEDVARLGYMRVKKNLAERPDHELAPYWRGLRTAYEEILDAIEKIRGEA